MARFRITYVDPETITLHSEGEEVTVEKEFYTDSVATAREWAEDWAYNAADKGPSRVEEIK